MKELYKKKFKLPTELFEIYAKEHSYLYIQNSSIPNSGKGLFTAIPIFKDERIAVFTGEILTSKESILRSRNNKDQYFINMVDGTILDSIASKCFAKYANDAFGFSKTTFTNNAYITIDSMNNVCIAASKKINAYTEIFCSYGKSYWKNYRKF